MQIKLVEIIPAIMMFVVPIIWMLLSHQRRMTELIHRQNRGEVDNAELTACRREIAELRAVVQSQAIYLDDVRSQLTTTRHNEPVIAREGVHGLS